MLSSNPEQENTVWMVVYVTHNITEGHIVAGRLQSEGIMAILDHMAGMNAVGITIGSFGEVRVLVHPQNYEAALAILDVDEPGELPESTGYIVYDDDQGGDADE